MAQSFMLHVPDYVTGRRLASDLDEIITRHRGILVYNVETPSQNGLQDTRVYEISSTGTITTMTNEENYFVANTPDLSDPTKSYSAMVICTGFDEGSMFFHVLKREFLDVAQRY